LRHERGTTVRIRSWQLGAWRARLAFPPGALADRPASCDDIRVSSSRRHLLVGALALAACRLRSHAAGPRVRQPAPAFELPDEAGRNVSLAQLRARGPVVLVFYRGHW